MKALQGKKRRETGENAVHYITNEPECEPGDEGGGRFRESEGKRILDNGKTVRRSRFTVVSRM
jgi:hypothetical protein